MSNLAKTESPVKGLTFTTWSDKKFRSESITVRFKLKVDERLVQHYQLLTGLLTETTAAYPDKSSMSEALKDLYGALLQTNFTMIGDALMISFTISCIADRYTMYGEKITDRCAELLLGILFEPNIVGGGFAGEIFDQEKRALAEYIKQLSANRHKYALDKARMTAFAGEPAGIDMYGTVEQLEGVTAEQVYGTYKAMLDTAGISVMFCGKGENESAQELVRRRFIEYAQRRLAEGDPARVSDKRFFLAPSPLKPQVCELRESIKQAQLKLVMYLKTSSEDMFAERVASKLFGGTAFSMLFANVREKLSLCYYCSARYREFKNAVIIDCGVEAKNEMRAREEILRQLELLKQGEFTDELLENTKKTHIDETRNVTDNAFGFSVWHEIQSSLGESCDPDEIIREFKEVTRERVVKAADSFKLDTVFVLEPTKSSDGASDTDGEEEQSE